MTFRTLSPKTSQVNRRWHLLDAADQVLGRLATQASIFLMGKHKPEFSRHLDIGDHVVILNAEKIVVTGRKENQKIYSRHSGFPGGFRQDSLARLRSTHPDRILTQAISGMLPHNKLHDQFLTRLHVIVGSQNPYAKAFK